MGCKSVEQTKTLLSYHLISQELPPIPLKIVYTLPVFLYAGKAMARKIHTFYNTF